ncbi:methyltransferase [Klebsiella pneumoniae]|uniref:Methyltransferase n=1 Tax=Klebsiella pneumoniae TaxID=573 RepID=A0A2X3FJ42_KLEPN|nr:methyltransferase [Klebsiella pneumoniae]
MMAGYPDRFNPVSLMGLRKLVPVLRKGTPYNSRMFTLMRQLTGWRCSTLKCCTMDVTRFALVAPWRQIVEHPSAGAGLFAIDCRPQTDHSADAQSDEIRQSENSAAAGGGRHPAVAQRAELTLRQVPTSSSVGWEAAARPARRSVHFQDGRRGPLPIPI